MLKSLVKVLGLVIGLVLSGFSCAMSMGDINVANTLGEPMNVLIELGTASKDEIGSLSARLAPPEVFKDAGLDYPSGLPPLKFKIETNANGEPYIKITSVQPVNEPFVNLLVELVWSSGKLLREYTFLLDPPGYVPTQPKSAEVKPVEPSIVDVSELEPKGKEAIIKSPLPSTTPMVDEKKVVDEMPAAVNKPAVNKPNESSNVASGDIKVKRGDNLSKLAHQIKSSEISLERALVALYHANADAFDGKNMNRLKVGKILHMPEQSELDNLSQEKAVKEIRVQADDWHAYRQKLAAASGLATGDESRQETSGKISTSVADNAPAAKESVKEVVRLSKGEAPGDKTSSGNNAKALHNKIHAMEEESISKSKALQESNERVVALEKNVQDLRRLIDLKSQPPVAQGKPVQSPVEVQTASRLNEAQSGVMSQAPVVASQVANVASGVAAVSAVAAVSPVKPVKPITKPKVATQPSLLEVILDQPLYMAGAAAALLGLVGLGYSRTRRSNVGRENAKFDDKPIEHTIGFANKNLTSTPSSSKTDDLTNAITTVGVTGQAQADDFDPISGADLFLNFGRDEQAEKILKEALIKNPANHQIHLKLLSIYANRKDTRSFATIARQLRDSGDTNAWEQAAVMGIKLEPSNPMYGGSASAAVKGSLVAGLAPDAVLNEGKATKPPSPLDFDLDHDFSAPKASTGSTETSQSSFASKSATMDFDVTASYPKLPASSTGKTEASPMNLDEFMLDVTTNRAPLPPVITQEKTAAAAPAKVNEHMDFTLDFPSADKSADKVDVSPVKAVPKEIMDIGLGDISLNLDKPVVPAPVLSAEEKDAQWHDAASKLDLAKAYQEMGDVAGAREILEEVVREGGEQHRTAAEALLQQLPV